MQQYNFNKNALPKNKIIWAVIDIETTGLDRFKDKITMVGVYTMDDTGHSQISVHNIVDKNYPGTLMSTIERLRTDKAKLIYHNGKFDTLFLQTQFGIRLPIHEDTMLMSYCFDITDDHSLKSLCQKYLKVKDWDISKKDKTLKEDTPESRQLLSEYLKLDVEYTKELFVFLNSKMSEQQKYLYKTLLLPAYRAYKDIETTGIHFNTEACEHLKREYEEKATELRIKLDRRAASLGVSSINWNSPKQLSNFFFNTLQKMPIKYSPKTNEPSTDAETLKKLALQQRCKEAAVLSEYKKYQGALSKFLIPLPTFADDYDRIHPTFNIATVLTGRTSCSNPNLQQVPRDKSVRTLFDAEKGRVLIEADYSQLELRIAAELSHDPVMLQIYKDGKDIHTNTAATITNKSYDEVTKEERKKAKPVNFGFLYGMGAKKFVDYAYMNYDEVFSLSEAQHVRDMFFLSYPTLIRWHRECEAQAEMDGGVNTIFGRFRALPDIYSGDPGLKASAIRKSINTPVQSAGSDLLLCAVIELNKTLPREYDAYIVGTIHDSILVDAPEDTAKEIAEYVKQVMISPRLAHDMGVRLTVPLDVEYNIGKWGE